MRRIKLLLLLFVCSFAVQAQNYPSAPLDYVTDMADILDAGQEAALNKRLKAFEDSTSNQIFIYIGNSSDGRAMSDLCQEIFHKWKIGKEEKDNGVLVAVFVDDHKFRIHTGYGLEGALPDILTKRIQDTEMKPHFKNNDYYTGLMNGIDKLIYYSAHEFVAPPIHKKKTQKENYFASVMMAYGMNVVLLVINIYLLYNAAKNKNKSASARTWTMVVLIILFLIPCAGAVFLFIGMFVLGIKTREGAASGGTYSNSIDRDTTSSWSSSSNSDSGSDFSGGGGGDSGGGGSDSDW